MSSEFKISIQFLAELDQLRQAVPAIKGVFQQLVGAAREVGAETVTTAKSAGSVLLDQFGRPIQSVTKDLKGMAQAEQQAAEGAKATAKATGEAGQAADSAAGAAERAGRAMRRMGDDGKAGSRGAADGMRGASGEAGGFGAGLTALTKRLALAYVAMKTLRGAWGAIKEGLSFNAQMETAELGIGTLIAAQAKLVDATGQELKGREALNAALVLSKEQMQQLKIAGLETTATTEQLVVAFQQAVGVGLGVGMTLDQIRQITVKVVQAAGALGIPMNQLAEEVRDMLQGNINPRNTRIATALGLTGEDIRKWQAAGTLFDELNKRMEAFGLAGDRTAKTWSGVASNVIEAGQTLAGAMTVPLFNRIRDGLQEALQGVFDFKRAGISDAFSGLVDAGKEVFTGLGTLGQEAIRGVVTGLREASGWFDRNKVLVKEIVANAVDLVHQVFGLLGTLKDIASQLGLATGQVNLLSFAFKVLALTVAGLADGVRVIVALLLGFNAAWLKFLIYPVQKFLDVLAGALEFLGKGDWAAKLRGWSQSMQGVVDTMADKAKAIVAPVAEGVGAVGKLREAWAEAGSAQDREETKRKLTHSQAVKRLKEIRAEISQLTKEQDAAARAGGKDWDLAPAVQARAKRLAQLNQEQGEVASAAGLTLSTRRTAPEGAHKAVVDHEEVLARLAKYEADSAAKTTLEEEKKARILALQAETRKKTADLDKELAEGKYKRAGGEDDYWAQMTALGREYAAKRIQIDKDTTKARGDLEADLTARVGAQEEGGLAKRLEANRKYFQKVREDNERSKQDGKPFMTEDQIVSAEAAAAARERIAQVRADLQEINREMAEKAQQLGRGLNTQEQTEILDRYKTKGGTAGEAAGQKEKDLHMGEGGGAGFRASIDGYIATAQNVFQIWKGFGTAVLGGLESNFAGFFESLTQKGQSFGEKTKALWKGISSMVVKALAEMGAKELVYLGIKKLAAAWDAIRGTAQAQDTARTITQNTAKQASNTSTASTGFFASFAGMGPFGYALAIAAIVAMFAFLKGVTGRKVGGLVGEHGPEMTLLGEEGLEVVAPEKDFKDWAKGMVGMGATLQANLTREQRQVQGYQRQGADYAAAASQPAQGGAGALDGGGALRMTNGGRLLAATFVLQNPIFASSLDGQRGIRKMFKNAMVDLGKAEG